MANVEIDAELKEIRELMASQQEMLTSLVEPEEEKKEPKSELWVVGIIILCATVILAVGTTHCETFEQWGELVKWWSWLVGAVGGYYTIARSGVKIVRDSNNGNE